MLSVVRVFGLSVYPCMVSDVRVQYVRCPHVSVVRCLWAVWSPLGRAYLPIGSIPPHAVSVPLYEQLVEGADRRVLSPHFLPKTLTPIAAIVTSAISVIRVSVIYSSVKNISIDYCISVICVVAVN